MEYLDDILSDGQMWDRLDAHAVLEEMADHQPGPEGDQQFWSELREDVRNGRATIDKSVIGSRPWKSSSQSR